MHIIMYRFIEEIQGTEFRKKNYIGQAQKFWSKSNAFSWLLCYACAPQLKNTLSPPGHKFRF
jgi:hypothetical protein